MRVAIVSGPRSELPMGLELAERRLIDALRSNPGSIELDIRVVGRRRALRHARDLQARWIPSIRSGLPPAAEAEADLVHLIGLDLPPPSRHPFVATVHDLSPIHYDDEGSLPPWIDEVAARAQLLLTPSAFTANEIQQYLHVPPERIRVFGGGPALDARGAARLSATELAELRITPPVVLRYGGYTNRKDVPLLLEAWSRVPVGTLVLAGPPQPARDRVLRSAPSADRIVVLDYTSQALLTRLLRTAAVLVSTSAYEGFGLPPLEALAAGTPVVAVSSPFAQEICGNSALLVGRTPEEVATATMRLLHDPGVAQSLRDAGLRRASEMTWQSAASEVLRAYREAVEEIRLHGPGLPHGLDLKIT